MCDAKHEIQRVEMARWIASYISPIGDGTPWIEGHGVIKVETLTFVAKFSWLLNRYRLCPTIVDILLTQDGATLTEKIMVEYYIYFAAII